MRKALAIASLSALMLVGLAAPAAATSEQNFADQCRARGGIPVTAGRVVKLCLAPGDLSLDNLGETVEHLLDDLVAGLEDLGIAEDLVDDVFENLLDDLLVGLDDLGFLDDLLDDGLLDDLLGDLLGDDVLDGLLDDLLGDLLDDLLGGLLDL